MAVSLSFEYTFAPPEIDVAVGNELFLVSHTPKFEEDSQFFVYAFTKNLLQVETSSLFGFIYLTIKHFLKQSEYLDTTWQWIFTS